MKRRPKRAIVGHLQPLPSAPSIRLEMREPDSVRRPVGAYLQNLRDPVVLYADARCWRVNEDPPHVLADAPFDAVVLGKSEVYWCTPDREVRNFEQSFLLHAIQEVAISRPEAWGRALPANAVAVVMSTPSGQTLMVCPKKLATALERAVAKTRAAAD